MIDALVSGRVVAAAEAAACMGPTGADVAGFPLRPHGQLDTWVAPRQLDRLIR
jgi:hypothetical protein